MGLNEQTNRIYLNAVLGKLRKKVKEGDTGSKSRELKDGSVVWERVYNSVTGSLDNIVFHESDDYGNSWSVDLKDGEETYRIQVSENSRYGMDLLKKLPNLKSNINYKITPYDFEDNGKRRCGLSIAHGEEKITSYYQKFTKDGDKYTVENLHGYPSFNGDSKDKDDLKIYYTMAAKFLRKEALARLKDIFINTEDTVSKVNKIFPGQDDLQL